MDLTTSGYSASELDDFLGYTEQDTIEIPLFCQISAAMPDS